MISEEESFPSSSPEALANRDILFTQFNEVFFFVEDEDQENFYWELLRKLFPTLPFENVFPLGGKTAVITHVETNNSAHHIYILDKDLDDLLSAKRTFANVFYLDLYCIENYLLEEEAVLELLISEDPKLIRSEVRLGLEFGKFLSSVSRVLSVLFELFYVVQKWRLQIPSTGMRIFSFFSKKAFSPELVDDYYEKVKLQSVSQGLPIDWPKEMAEAHSIFSSATVSHQHISGKYVLEMLKCELLKKYNLRFLNEYALNYRLVRECSLNNMSSIKEAIWGCLCSIGIRPDTF